MTGTHESGDAMPAHQALPMDETGVFEVYHEYASLAQAECSCGWRSAVMDDGDARDAAWGHRLKNEPADKHAPQRDVEDFHRVVVGIEDSNVPAIRRPELRAALIEEEAKETVDAIRRGDLVEAIDGFCDLLCVVYGTAAEFGINLAPFWDEVHRTNMAKAGGPIREDGKRLKPEGWQPPDIAGLLAKLPRGGH